MIESKLTVHNHNPHVHQNPADQPLIESENIDRIFLKKMLIFADKTPPNYLKTKISF